MKSMRRKDFIRIQLLLWAVIVLMMPGLVHAATPNTSQAAGPQVQTVQSLEDTLFTFRYDQEPLEARIKRLEETVFGQEQSNFSTDVRISKLKSALSANALSPLKPSQAAQTPAAPNNNIHAAPSQNKAASQAYKPMPVQQPTQTRPTNPMPGETDYPTVGQMESKLFGKVFNNEDITQRLTRLEKQVFKTVQTGELADRVDNLRLVVLGDTGPSNHGSDVAYRPQTPSRSASAYQNMPTPPVFSHPSGPSTANRVPVYTQIPQGNPSYGIPAVSSPQAYSGQQQHYEQPVSYAGQAGNAPPTADMMAAMNEVEKEVLGTTYPAEPFNTRLDRIESKVFNSTSPEMSNEDRMQRVIAVASAGGAPQTGKAKAKSTFQSLLPVILTILPMLLL